MQADIVAGLTTGAVIIPKAMAYAMMAGLPVQVGLYTAFVPMLIYSVLGTSRVLSVSTSTTLAVLTAAQLHQFEVSGDASALLRTSATLAFLVGLALLLASFLRLGFVANFISEPVLVGFRAGIGMVIVVDQIPKMLGIHFPRRTFVQNIFATVHNLPKENATEGRRRGYHRSARPGVHRAQNVRTSCEEANRVWHPALARRNDTRSIDACTTVTTGANTFTGSNAFQSGDCRQTISEK